MNFPHPRASKNQKNTTNTHGRRGGSCNYCGGQTLGRGNGRGRRSPHHNRGACNQPSAYPPWASQWQT